MSFHLEFSDNDRRWLTLRTKIVENHIKSAFQAFRKQNIEPILIKGWAAALEYPEKYQRTFIDIDLAVAPDFYKDALPLLSSGEMPAFNIDLHCGLRHLDTLDWEILYANSRTVFLDEVPIRILSIEDHLRVLCVHWLTDGGAYKEKLLDVFYILENNKETFDWGKCLDPVSVRRREWIIKTVAVAHRIYGLDISRMPFASDLEKVPEWMLKALEREWASGTKLRDIHTVGGDKREFWNQLKKRLRPNPIQATVFMEGSFDAPVRVFYQIGSFGLRLKGTAQRLILRIEKVLAAKTKNNVER